MCPVFHAVCAVFALLNMCLSDMWKWAGKCAQVREARGPDATPLRKLDSMHGLPTVHDSDVSQGTNVLSMVRSVTSKFFSSNRGAIRSQAGTLAYMSEKRCGLAFLMEVVAYWACAVILSPHAPVRTEALGASVSFLLTQTSDAFPWLSCERKPSHMRLSVARQAKGEIVCWRVLASSGKVDALVGVNCGSQIVNLDSICLWERYVCVLSLESRVVELITVQSGMFHRSSRRVVDLKALSSPQTPSGALALDARACCMDLGKASVGATVGYLPVDEAVKNAEMRPFRHVRRKRVLYVQRMVGVQDGRLVVDAGDDGARDGDGHDGGPPQYMDDSDLSGPGLHVILMLDDKNSDGSVEGRWTELFCSIP